MTIYVVERTRPRPWSPGPWSTLTASLAGQTDNSYGDSWSYLHPGPTKCMVYRKGLLTAAPLTINFTPGGNYTIVMRAREKSWPSSTRTSSSHSLGKEIVRGAINTIKLSLIAFAVGILIGLVMGIGRMSHNFIFRAVSSVYVEGVRGLAAAAADPVRVITACHSSIMDITGGIFNLSTSFHRRRHRAFDEQRRLHGRDLQGGHRGDPQGPDGGRPVAGHDATTRRCGTSYCRRRSRSCCPRWATSSSRSSRTRPSRMVIS